MGADDLHPLLVVNVLAFVSAKFERGIKRAEGNYRREKEDRAKHNQNDPEGAGDNATKVQVGKQGSEHHTDDAIGVRHIAFHVIFSFGNQLGFTF